MPPDPTYSTYAILHAQGISTNRRTKWTDEELEALVHFILKGFREKWPADRVDVSKCL